MCIQDRFKSSADIRKEFLDASVVEINSTSVRRRLINAPLTSLDRIVSTMSYTDLTFTYDGMKELTLINGGVNGNAYISILKRHLLPVS